MSLLTYKVLHITGVLFLFLALGAGILRSSMAATRAEAEGSDRRLIPVTHGLALLLILVAGFGAVARLGLGFPPWVWVKMGIWLVMAVLLVVVRRTPRLAAVWWVVVPLLGAAAAYLALFKPF